MDAALIRAYLSRDFDGSAEQKRAHWADAFQRHGPAATLSASDALREHVRAIRPEWPTEAERAADLSHHVAQRRLFERIADGLARR